MPEDTGIYKKISEIVRDCLITGETEREAREVTYGNHDYWTDQICAALTEWIEGKKRKLAHPTLKHKGEICDACSEDFTWNSALSDLLSDLRPKEGGKG